MATARRVIDREALVRGAALHFLRDATLDMDALAAELVISRATLYRAVGSRDALLGEVFRYFGRRLVDEVRTEAMSPGADGVIEATRVYAELVREAQPLRRFIAAEPDTALRVLFTAAGDVHRRAVEEQLARFRKAGFTGPEPDLRRRAFLYYRIVESVIYGELFGVADVDLELAEPALRALLPDPQAGALDRTPASGEGDLRP